MAAVYRAPLLPGTTRRSTAAAASWTCVVVVRGRRGAGGGAAGDDVDGRARSATSSTHVRPGVSAIGVPGRVGEHGRRAGGYGFVQVPWTSWPFEKTHASPGPDEVPVRRRAVRDELHDHVRRRDLAPGAEPGAMNGSIALRGSASSRRRVASQM